MNVFVVVINHAAACWWPNVAHAAWQSALVAALVLTATRLGRRWPAPVRFALLLIALLKFAFPPFIPAVTGVFSAVGPRIDTAAVGRIRQTRPPSASLPVDSPDPLAKVDLAQTASIVPNLESVGAPEAAENGSAALVARWEGLHDLSWQSWLLLCHTAGFLTCLLTMARQLSVLRSAVRNAQAVTSSEVAKGLQSSRGLGVENRLPLLRGIAFRTAPAHRMRQSGRTPSRPRGGGESECNFALRPRGVGDTELSETFGQIAVSLGLRRFPRLLISRVIDTPIAFGVLRPTVMLPAAIVERLPLTEIKTILAHELAHYRRADLWVNWVQLALRAVWWFHPMLWLLDRALRKTREDCCDDLLLARGMTSNDAYCDILMRAASELSGRTPVVATLGFAEQLHPLGRRLARIMDRSLTRKSGLSPLGFTAMIVLCGLILPGLRCRETLSAATPVADFDFGSRPPDQTEDANPSTKATRDEPAPPIAVDRSDPAESTPKLSERGAGANAESMKTLFPKLRWFGDRVPEFNPLVVASKKLVEQMGIDAVPFLVKKLREIRFEDGKDLSVDDRRRAAWALGQLGRAAKWAVPALIEALGDQERGAWQTNGIRVLSERVCTIAATALGEIGPDAKAAVPELVASLRDGVGSSLVALARIAPESDEVVRILQDAPFERSHPAYNPETSFGVEAVRALEILADRNPAAFSTLAAALAEHDLSVRDEASKALVKRIEDSPTVARLINEALRRGDLSQREGVAVAMTHAGHRTTAVLEALLDCVNDPEIHRRHAAMAALPAFGDRAKPAIPALLKAVENESSMTRFLSIMALGYLGRGDQAIARTLAAHLNDPAPLVRMVAINALADFGPENRAAGPHVFNALADADREVRRAAATALGKFDFDPQQGVPTLIRLLEDGDGMVRSAALRGLGSYGANAKGAIHAMTRLLENPKPEAAEAAAALGQIGPAAKAAVPALSRALQSGEAGVRNNASLALGKIGTAARASIPALAALLNDPDGGVRHNAAFSLWQIDGQTNIVGILIERLKSDENLNYLERLNPASTRVFNIRQLGEIGPSAKAAIPRLNEALKSDDDGVRAAAEEALQRIGAAH